MSAGRVLRLALAPALMAGLAHADCYADYKARQQAPFALHYGVAQITGPCTTQDAAAELTPRLAAAGWRLLTVVSVFDAEGLEERRANAGDFFLRY